MFSNFQYFLLFVITMALIIDTAEAVYRYFKYKIPAIAINNINTDSHPVQLSVFAFQYFM